MYTEKMKKEYELVLKSLNNTHNKIIKSLENLDNYLNKNPEISQEEKFLTEDFFIVLDIIRSQIKGSIFILKKHKIEQEEKVTYIKHKESDDIYVDSSYRIDHIFKKE